MTGLIPDRKQPGLPFWTTILLVVGPVAYTLSFGPACWITSRINVGASAIPVVYRPLTWAMSPNSITAINRVSTWYAKVGAAEDWEWGPVHDSAGGHVGWMWGSISSTSSDIF